MDFEGKSVLTMKEFSREEIEHIFEVATSFGEIRRKRLDPGLTYEATKWFADNNVKIHGIEGPSTDHPDDMSYPAHRACRDFGITHIECLANLEEVVNKRFIFIGFPLKMIGTTGAPIRAVALIE